MENNIAHASLEISKGWAKQFPELFTSNIIEFFEKYPSNDGWYHRTRIERDGFFYFHASKKGIDESDMHG